MQPSSHVVSFAPRFRLARGATGVLVALAAAALPAAAQLTGSGTAGRVPKFLTSSDLGDSLLFESASGRIGIGVENPLRTLDVGGDALVRGFLGVNQNAASRAFIVNQKGSGAIADFRSGGEVRLFLSNAGDLGLGTTTPDARLDVAGSARLEGPLAVGNAAEFGIGADQYEKLFDVSHAIADFSSSGYWTPFRSHIAIDSDADLTGDRQSAVFSHDLEAIVPATNDKSYYWVNGPTLLATHAGFGSVDNLVGGAIGTETIGAGSVGFQAGADIESFLRGPGTIGENAALWVFSGNRDATGTIGVNHAILVESPFADGPMGAHHGLYLKDQSAGGDGYALYSEGGRSYFAGNVGIGTDEPDRILTIPADSPTDPIAHAWTTYSSRRFKENVAPIEGALEKIERLRGVTYDWKGTKKRDIGLIAEEVGEVLPEIVEYEANGTDAKSIDYARITAVLVEAVKAQEAAIASLRAEVAALKAAGGEIAGSPRR